MDNKNQNEQSQPIKPAYYGQLQQPSPAQNDTTQLSQSPQPQVILSENSLNIARPAKHYKKIILYTVLVVIFIVILISLTAVFQNPNGGKASSNLHANTQTNNNISGNTSRNPFNSGTINQQVQYCSNLINADTVC
jgi:hypothetical protein